jgi:hypothetical protein
VEVPAGDSNLMIELDDRDRLAGRGGVCDDAVWTHDAREQRPERIRWRVHEVGREGAVKLPGSRGPVWAVVPVKPFHLAKRRRRRSWTPRECGLRA